MSTPLDLRHLPAPEPMQRILDALEDLPRGHRFEALTPHPPGPLLPILERWGFDWHVEALGDGTARIVVFHAPGGCVSPVPGDPR